MRHLCLMLLCLLAPFAAWAGAPAWHGDEAAMPPHTHRHHALQSAQSATDPVPELPAAQAALTEAVAPTLTSTAALSSCHGLGVTAAHGHDADADTSPHASHQGGSCQACHAVWVFHHGPTIVQLPRGDHPASAQASMFSADLRRDRRPPRAAPPLTI